VVVKSVQVALVAAWTMFDGGGACLDVIWSFDKAFLFLGQVFLLDSARFWPVFEAA
jgi:hypothetical protein